MVFVERAAGCAEGARGSVKRWGVSRRGQNATAHELAMLWQTVFKVQA